MVVLPAGVGTGVSPCGWTVPLPPLSRLPQGIFPAGAASMMPRPWQPSISGRPMAPCWSISTGTPVCWGYPRFVGAAPHARGGLHGYEISVKRVSSNRAQSPPLLRLGKERQVRLLARWSYCAPAASPVRWIPAFATPIPLRPWLMRATPLLRRSGRPSWPPVSTRPALRQWPAREKRKLVVLSAIAEQFTPRPTVYGEGVNRLLGRSMRTFPYLLA